MLNQERMSETDSSDSSWDFQEEDEPAARLSSYDHSRWRMAPCQGGGGETSVCSGAEQVSTSNRARADAINQFTEMGFNEHLVIRTIDEHGEENTDAILEDLLTYKNIEECSPRGVFSCPNSPDSEWDSLGDLSGFSDAESYMQNEVDLEPLLETKEMQLVNMGYSIHDVSRAINSCGPDTSISDLVDFIFAAQLVEPISDHPCERPLQGQGPPDVKKKKQLVEQEYGERMSAWGNHREVEWEKKRKTRMSPDADEALIKVPKVMTGFGVPGHSSVSEYFKRRLLDVARPPPYFYFENVAKAPKGTWSKISRSLFNIEPEFVDSKYFSAAMRKRGYIHNLPTKNRTALFPIPPLTIHEILPRTSRFWPPWDTRVQFNCLRTRTGSAKLMERISIALQGWGGDPPQYIQKKVLKHCRSWNFVWTAKDSVSPLSPEEIEQILGYPKYHTRRGATHAERYEALGNSFQINTVAYHLSVLKEQFKGGIKVLSLFSGIGGAEIALDRLGIPLRLVVSVEFSEVNRNILRSWWNDTRQTGILVDDTTDVRMLTNNKLEKLVKKYGGFDLVIGGSPCNNITGSNRWHRVGLEGAQSVLFYDYCRILVNVIRLMRENTLY
ncbi:hypothetical protein MKW92_046921 [Papaver armeniacum]|nr:hypothetical protein MKW92_046921 [Papaver armeniacum]